MHQNIKKVFKVKVLETEEYLTDNLPGDATTNKNSV